MAWCPPAALPLLLVHFIAPIWAQVPATNTPVPPLQWLELTHLFNGSSPPGLKDASIGYDETSRTLILFGGESNGFVQQQTYLLELDKLQWSLPSPPIGFNLKPPPRSAAISGGDFAASNRHAHLVIGGKGSDGKGLRDAWEFDYNNQFWSEVNIDPGGPSARWGSSGGTDLLSAAIQDPVVPGPNNTFYVAGGFDGSSALPLSDIWSFKVGGVLSPNNENGVLGSWQQVKFSTKLPTKVRQAGAVMPSGKVVAVGGCTTASVQDNSCAQQDAFIINVNSTSDIAPSGCPAPRVGANVVPNYNTLSTSFITQAFMMLGTYNSTMWDDSNGLNIGEVDVLDTETGSWTRILPSGDPGSGSLPPRFPTPREGAAALSYPLALVGKARTTSSDTIIFGGRDANGNYLQDVWLLRAYLGQITSTNQTWNGFGDGQLQSGVDASGAGVSVQYITSCARNIESSTSPSPSPTSSGGSSTGLPAKSKGFPYETSSVHKILSPLSVALLLGAVISFRLSSPSASSTGMTDRNVGFLWFSVIAVVAAYAAGIGGVIDSFSTISLTKAAATKRSINVNILLKTGHGLAGIVFFAGLYLVVPFLLGIVWFTGRTSGRQEDGTDEVNSRARCRTNSGTAFLAGEKVTTPSETTRQAVSPSQSSLGVPTPGSPAEASAQAPSSWGAGRLWSGYQRKSFPRRSSESEPDSNSEAGAPRGFEVLNRGPRVRRGSDQANTIPRNLSDVSWLDRRRALGAVGELDYVMSQLPNQRSIGPMPGTEPPSSTQFMVTPHIIHQPQLPSPFQCLVRIVLHALLLGINGLSLVAFWVRTQKVFFIIFLLWTLAFYVALFLLSWSCQPRISILAVLLSSLRTGSHLPIPPASTTPPPSRPLSTNGLEQYVFPTDARGPYTFHQPPYRRALSTNEDELPSSAGHGLTRQDNDDDEDEETQQRRIEQEMDRRDVSIVTVPKRKLWIANPT